MLVMVSGPFTAETREEEGENLARINRAAAEVLRRGHVPVVGMHAARPVVEAAGVEDRYEAVMRISLALAERCDALLFVGESGGACREREVFERKGLPVYTDAGELPEAARAAADEAVRACG